MSYELILQDGDSRLILLAGYSDIEQDIDSFSLSQNYNLGLDTSISEGVNISSYTYENGLFDAGFRTKTTSDVDFDEDNFFSNNINLNVGVTNILAKADDGKTLLDMFLNDIHRGDGSFIDCPVFDGSAEEVEEWSAFLPRVHELNHMIRNNMEMTDEQIEQVNEINAVMNNLYQASHDTLTHDMALDPLIGDEAVPEDLVPLLKAAGYYKVPHLRKVSIVSNLKAEILISYLKIDASYSAKIAQYISLTGQPYDLEALQTMLKQKDRPALRAAIQQHSEAKVMDEIRELVVGEDEPSDFHEVMELFDSLDSLDQSHESAYIRAKEEGETAFRNNETGGSALAVLLLLHPSMDQYELDVKEAFDVPIFITNFLALAQLLSYNELKIYFMTERLEITLDDNSLQISELPAYLLDEREVKTGKKKFFIKFRNESRTFTAKAGTLILLSSFFGALKVSSMNPDLLSDRNSKDLSGGGLDINFIRELSKLDNFCVLYNRRIVTETRDDYSKPGYMGVVDIKSEAAVKFRGACSTVLFVTVDPKSGFSFRTDMCRMKMVRHGNEVMETLDEANQMYLHKLKHVINEHVLKFEFQL